MTTADPLCTPGDVAARWRPLSDAEMQVAVVLCEDASALLRAEYPTIDSRIVTGDLDPRRAEQAASAMVKRALLAPADGVDSTTETVGPFTISTRYNKSMEALFITAAEDLLIRGYRPRAVSMRYA